MNTWDHEQRRSGDMGGVEINYDNIMAYLK
jgi:hypothetical protein